MAKINDIAVFVQNPETEDEQNLLDYLIEKKKETNYIYLALAPAGEPYISRRAVNRCTVTINGKVKSFNNVSESFYDEAVKCFDKRSN